jgi:pimeloyl-ACP methyl ester carboxylesterase
MADIRTRHVEANGLSFLIDEAGEGDDVALLLHGFPESRRCWRHQLPILADLGWRGVAPDLRGYGGSSRPSARSDYRMDHLVADAGALFDALGARRRLMIGHDWGGIVAWTFAIRQARPLDGLVILNAPHPAVFNQVIRSSWRQRLRSWYALFFQLPWLPERLLTAKHAFAVAQALRKSAWRAGTFPPDILAHYRASAAEPGAMTAMLSYYRANLRHLGLGPERRVAASTLLIWGERDTALGPELVAPTADHVADLAIHRLPEVSHWVPEEAPEAVNAALSAWLRQRGLGD